MERYVWEEEEEFGALVRVGIHLVFFLVFELLHGLGRWF